MAKAALGKGLGALIGKPAEGAPAANFAPFAPQPAPGEVVRKVALGEVVPSPLQPRKEFAPEQLSELMESIREHGIIQPLEEAQAYARLSKEFGLRQEDIAQRVGKNRATVANAIRLLDLPAVVQTYLREGKLSTGHAKVLLALKNPGETQTAAEEVIRKSLTVRATEKLVDLILHPPPPKPKPAELEGELRHALHAIEHNLTRHLSTAVKVHHGEKKGRLEIEYYSVDDLNRLLDVMGMPSAE
jgi:ParB family chromosome partitioning protein